MEEKQNKQTIDELPEAFSQCTVLMEATLEGSLPIFIGRDEHTGEYYFSLEKNHPYRMNFDSLVYIRDAINKLMLEHLMEGEDISKEAAEDKIQTTSDYLPEIVIGEGTQKEAGPLSDLRSKILGSNPNFHKVNVEGDDVSASGVRLQCTGEEAEEIQGILEDDTLSQEEQMEKVAKKVEELRSKGRVESIDREDIEDNLERKEEHDGRQDMNTILEGMSPEEREEFNKALAQEKKKKVEELGKSLEERLRGDLQTEESEDLFMSIEDYFALYEKEGMAAVREELAKIPKENRKGIIKQIQEKYDK